MSAALAEAAADTASSEVGKAFGGAPRLVTTWRTVPAGTDGAITMLGTFAALGSALVVGLVGVVSGVLPVRELGVCLVAGFAGTVADSLLGATMERKGLLENNGVNLISTAVAAVLAWVVGSHFVHVA
jgi:uncharacterized protein (TIGR00297 family)